MSSELKHHKMSIKQLKPDQIEHILQYFYDKGKSESDAAKRICDVYGADAVSLVTVKWWYKRFSYSPFAMEPKRLHTTVAAIPKVNKIVEAILIDRHATCASIAQEQSRAPRSVQNRLRMAGFRSLHNVWVPLKLTQQARMDRIFICESLLNRYSFDQFLPRMVVEDQIWLTYDHTYIKGLPTTAREAAQTVAQPALTTTKVLLCVWWDWMGIIHFELLPDGQTLNSELHCQQLTRLRQSIYTNRPVLAKGGLVLHQGNAKQYASATMLHMLCGYGWELLIHPPDSPDLAPSDYHLFPTMQNARHDVKLASRDDCAKWVPKFNFSMNQTFWWCGIVELLFRWKQVIEKNGEYLT